MLLKVELNRVISEDEVIHAIKGLKNNKACGYSYTSIIICICRVTLALIYGYTGTFRPSFRYTSRIKNNVK
jgi:glutaredoxin-related protein